MSEPRVAPYGTWPSPITRRRCSVDIGVELAEPWIEDGAVWWLESRPAEGGRGVIVRSIPGPRRPT